MGGVAHIVHTCVCLAGGVFSVMRHRGSHVQHFDIPSEHFERLALKCGVDAAELETGYSRVRPLVLRECATSGCDNRRAWTSVLGRIRANPVRATAYPVKALVPVLATYFAYSPSTCGVGQGFAATETAMGNRHHMNSLAEECTTALVAARQNNTKSDGELCKVAQQVWAQQFGFPRVSGARAGRVDKGVKRKRTSQLGEAAFIRKRRRAAARAAVVVGRSAGVVVADGTPESLPGWGDAHEAELAFCPCQASVQAGASQEGKPSLGRGG